ncbi:MAG: hypothetical protein U1F26_08190 [Lysobacterales bacterium]
MYESRRERPLGRPSFYRRMFWHLAGAMGLLAASLGIGIAGYMVLEQLSPLDAFLNAAMLLGGMGPVHLPATAGGKLFAGCYALYAGLVFIVTAAMILSPVVHRILHKFHWETD